MASHWPKLLARRSTLTNLQGTDAGSYWVVVSNQSRSVTSAVAVLTVNLATADTFNPGANNDVYCLAVQADGKILVGGLSPPWAGRRATGLAGSTANGTLDTTFNPAASGSV